MNYKKIFGNIRTNFEISKISTSGIKKFFSLYIGLICFMRNEHIMVLTKESLNKK